MLKKKMQQKPYHTTIKTQNNILQNVFICSISIHILLLESKFIFCLSLFIFGLAFYFQRSRPYWIIFVLILIFQLFSMIKIQIALLVLAFVILHKVKLYEIPNPTKQYLKSGYKATYLNELQVGLFYPTLQQGRKANWFPKSDYYKTLYDIFYVNPQTKRMPYFLFAFMMAFITKINMPAFINAKLYEKQNKKYKVIVFSHGMGSHLNFHSSICSWFSSQGYIVVTVQHDHDEIRLQYNHLPAINKQKVISYFYQKRNRDIQIRVTQVTSVLESIVSGNLFKESFEEQVQVQEIHLFGHSYGGATVLQTLSELIKNKQDSIIKSTIILDPWMFPLNDDVYETVKSKNILTINSQTFLQTPLIYSSYQLQECFKKLKKSNFQTLKAFFITNQNHLDQTDMAFVLGNILGIFRKNAHNHLCKQVTGLNVHIIQKFLQGSSVQQIISSGNNFCQENQMKEAGFQVIQEFRESRQNMFQFMKQRQQKWNTQTKLQKIIKIFKIIQKQ